jgi:hypothetical protein
MIAGDWTEGILDLSEAELIKNKMGEYVLFDFTGLYALSTDKTPERPAPPGANTQACRTRHTFEYLGLLDQATSSAYWKRTPPLYSSCNRFQYV